MIKTALYVTLELNLSHVWTSNSVDLHLKHISLKAVYVLHVVNIRPRSMYQYSNMAPRLSGQTSIFGVVFFVSKSLLGIEG